MAPHPLTQCRDGPLGQAELLFPKIWSTVLAFGVLTVCIREDKNRKN